MKNRTLILKSLLLVGSTGIFLLLIVRFTGIGNASKRNESIIREFNSNPSQQNADKVMDLINQWQLSSKAGSELLKRMTTPRVMTLNPQPTNRKTVISLSWPYDLKFRHFKLRGKVRIISQETGKESYSGSGLNLDISRRCPRLLTSDRMRSRNSSSGRVSAAEQIHYKLIIEQSLEPSVSVTTHHIGPFSWKTSPKTPKPSPDFGSLYEWTAEVPFTINMRNVVTPPEMKGTIHEQMHVGIHAAPFDITGEYSTLSGIRYYRFGLAVFLRWLPKDVCLRARFRFEDGAEIEAADFKKICHPLDQPRPVLYIGPDEFLIERTGQIKGTIILVSGPPEDINQKKADENAIHPRDYWEGSLEYPIEFEISEQPFEKRQP